MSIKFISNFIIGIHLTSMYSCALFSGFETLLESPRFFSNKKDDLHTACARGLIKGMYLPFNVLKKLPIVWYEEKHPWE